MNKVLVVEDEKMIRKGIVAMIHRSGVPVNEVLECVNGEAALEILRSQQIDMMFTDIRMPKMDGIELVHQMQQLEQMPFTVAISGYDDFSYAVEMLRTGVKEYLLKPIDRDKIKTIMERCEQELGEQEKKEAQEDQIGYQQLKYLILNQGIGREEIASIISRFEDKLMPGQFYVCVDSKRWPVNDQIPYTICLPEVAGSTLYIVPYEKIEEFQEEELLEHCIGISGLHSGIQEFKQAYEEGMLARKYAFCRKRKRVLYEKALTLLMSVGDTAAMHRIVQLVGTDKYEESLRQLEQMNFIMKWQQGDICDFEKNMSLLVEGIDTTYGSDLEKSTIHALCNMYAYEEIDTFAEELTEVLIRIHERLCAGFSEYRNRQKIRQALLYIEDNYDKELNMAMVSNYVSMNYSLFSYEFKEQTGKNFVNYLKELRMRKAKQLLAETEDRIQEISRQTGYENEKHFMKVFKAEFGVSPTEYRKNMQAGKE